MLRAHALAAAAADTLARLAASVCGQYRTVEEIHIPVVKCLLGIQAGKHIRDTDMLRTVILIHTVVAGGTWNHIQSVEHLHNLCNRILLLRIERLKFLHIGQIIFHLL